MARAIAEKTRNAKTMTESAFWSMIRSCLRQKSRWWLPIKECKENARRAYKGSNKRIKWEYQCANCKKWFVESQINVDHIVEAGSLKSSKDVGDFIERLFCETDGFQILCATNTLKGKRKVYDNTSCHYKKTLESKNK